MDLEHATLSLGSLFGVLGFVFGLVASIVAWLGRSAYQERERRLEDRLGTMDAATRAAQDDARKAREELLLLTRAQLEMKADLDKRVSIAEGYITVLRGDSKAFLEAKEYFASEFKSQNVTLDHQNAALADIKQQLSRKISASDMPAVGRRDDRREPSDRPYEPPRKR